MATANQSQSKGKKMEYKRVKFDVNEITPDAPEGEWAASIPRGKCKVQPTKEHKFPMLIVPVRLEKTEEDGPEFEKALGTELSTFLVFGGNTPAAERMNKIRVRQICEAADIDLDIIPKDIGEDPESELEPLIRALEGKKFTVWTKLNPRKDTGEIVSELRFTDPNATISRAGDDDDDDDADDEDEGRQAPAPRAAKKKKKKAAANKNSNGGGGKRE
jgi:hypothetical protein